MNIKSTTTQVTTLGGEESLLTEIFSHRALMTTEAHRKGALSTEADKNLLHPSKTNLDLTFASIPNKVTFKVSTIPLEEAYQRSSIPNEAHPMVHTPKSLEEDGGLTWKVVYPAEVGSPITEEETFEQVFGPGAIFYSLRMPLHITQESLVPNELDEKRGVYSPFTYGSFGAQAFVAAAGEEGLSCVEDSNPNDFRGSIEYRLAGEFLGQVETAFITPFSYMETGVLVVSDPLRGAVIAQFRALSQMEDDKRESFHAQASADFAKEDSFLTDADEESSQVLELRGKLEDVYSNMHELGATEDSTTIRECRAANDEAIRLVKVLAKKTKQALLATEPQVALALKTETVKLREDIEAQLAIANSFEVRVQAFEKEKADKIDSLKKEAEGLQETLDLLLTSNFVDRQGNDWRSNVTADIL